MLKRWRIAPVFAVAMLISLLISACGSTTTGSGGGTPTSSNLGTPGEYSCVSGSIVADGSTALQPLVSAVAKDYQKKCSSANITVNPGGSKTGLSDVESGAVQIGNSDIYALPNQTDLVDHQVAVVIFTLIVNSDVTGVTNLSTAQIKGIFDGSITNWNQVGGPNLKIVIVNRPSSSGTRATFQSYILGGPETVQSSSSLTSDSTGTVVQDVKQTSGAIGYAAYGPAKAASLTILNIDGNAPTNSMVESNTYKFWNAEHMYTKGQGTGLAQALIDYMLSPSGKSIAAGLAFIPTTDMQSSALQAHAPKS
ncbi:MAG TPA: phosphate ABC transporter substrate-binding protein [Ktedonobacteraceae bacterium]|nr:phosphate ABC transporter substrate-binding protein [Ktedonobacteraceae bacterium]